MSKVSTNQLTNNMTTYVTIPVPQGYCLGKYEVVPIVANEPPAHPQPEQPEQEAGEPRQRLWPEAPEGTLLHDMDNLIGKRYTRNSEIPREQKENLVNLKMLNVNHFKRVIRELRFSANERKNLLANVWRLERPDLASENARRARENRRARRNNNVPL